MRRAVGVGLVSVVGLLPSGSVAQAPPRAERAAELVRLALDEGRAFAILSDLTRVAPKRLSGSPGAAAAVAWAQETMRELGLERVREQEVTVPRWVRGDVETLELVGVDDAAPLPILALGGSVGTSSAGVEAELIVVRGFEQLRELGDRARGKMVLFNRPMPRALLSTFRAYGQAVPQRTNGAVEAAKVGAVAALVRSMTTRIDDVPHTGAVRYADAVPPVPAAAVSTAAADALAARLKSGETVRLRLRLACETLPETPSANVLGEIRGTERPEEIVLVGAHLDSWDVGQGAHDDGAGCAHVLEAMRLIKAAGGAPKRTIRAVLFMNEENGLRGARAYAIACRDELGQHVAAIETDAGGFEPKGFNTSADETRREVLRAALEPLREYGMGALIPGGGGADISVLKPHGVPLFGLAVTSHRYFDVHHSARDTIDQVHERELALGAAAVAYLAWSLADE
ncbi:MAG: M20/M25/M40 family metallo-hydrolase [Planctomycetota bacterium]